MVKVAVSCDGDYSVVAASNLDTPYQILSHKHINPERKVFINGKAATPDRMNKPFAEYEPGCTIYITVKF